MNKVLKDNEIVLYYRFTDYVGNSIYDANMGKANEDLKDFLNKHPYITIISLNKRNREIKNCGNGEEYYDLDLIFKVEKKYCKENICGELELL